ncbi:glycosyltransferase [Streptomyces hygroscopicus]|uniref:glycosyltransferase n=1 Tax=Streptomyces hygroscopicus TaxID=1912 RepID=UPI0036925B85
MAPRMRVLVIIPAWSAVPAAGAFVTTREYALGLASAGHTVDVVTSSKDPGEAYTDGSVRVWPLRLWRHAVRAARPELLISHHGDRRGARIVAQTPRVPHLLMVHGMSPHLDLGRPALTWFPSRACRDHYPYRGRSVVLSPPVDPGRYRTNPGDLIALNGTTAAKGADILAAIAEQLPDRQFLAVRTPWHDPVPLPGNVEIIDRTEPRTVYARTRVLLMPSQTESWGRVGVEAMLSGIPVLATPLPGIQEALGVAARYVPRDDVARWVAELRRLDDPSVYEAAAAQARAHTDTVDYTADLRAFEQACRTAARSRPATRRARTAPAPAVPPRRPAAQAPVQGPLRAPRVVAWVHYGVPYRRAGSETMLHTMMRTLHEAGMPVLVVCSDMPEAPAWWEVDGVPYAHMGAETVSAYIRSARPGVVVTHHDYAARAVRLARETGARSALLVHSDMDVVADGLTADPDLVVYNTDWIIKSLAPRYPQVDQVPRLVVHPPVAPGEHQAPPGGTHITLVNLNQHKGVDTWRGAARLLPRLPFLGVTGAHGPQVTRPRLRNTRIIPQTSNMRRDVWARTRVLLVPSVYESYGMAAVEALASRIPVIAHPTPGLREALGEAATFVHRDDHRAWTAAIRDLYRDGPRRARTAAAARARSAFLAEQSRTELAAWVEAVRALNG